MSKDDEHDDEHDALIRSVDDKLDKIDRKLAVVSEKVTDAESAILGEVRRVERQVAQRKEVRGL